MKTLLDYFNQHVKEKPNQVSFYDWDSKKKYNWQELDSISEQIAERLSVPSDNDEFILLCTPQNIYFPASLLACWKKNKIPILIHEKYTESELVEIKTIINNENVSVLLDSTYDLNIVHKFEKLFTKVIILNNNPVNLMTINSPPSVPNDLALGLFTSGTSDLPKLCVFTHAALLAGAEIEQKNEQYKNTDCIMNLRPHYTSAGLNTLLPSLLLGIQNTLSESVRLRPIPRFINKILNSINLSHVILSPSYIISLFQNGTEFINAPVKLKLYYGGNSLPITMIQKLIFNNFLPSMRYGMTEIAHIVSKINYGLNISEYKSDDVGYIYSGFETKIVNHHLAIQSLGLASFQIQLGRKISLLNQNWFQTEDHAVINSKGFLQLDGRQNQSVAINGFRFHVSQVEQLALEVQFVVDCRAVSINNEYNEPRLVLFIIGQEESDKIFIESEIKTLIHQKLSQHKWPSKYIFLKNWPVVENGKINFSNLRAKALDSIK